MITEELGVIIQQSLGPLIGIKEVQILTQDEYKNKEQPQDWFDDDAPQSAHILYIQLSLEPQNHLIKQITDITHHTRSQVHYIPSRDGSEHVYICPTTNNFNTLYDIAPANPKRFFK